MMPRLFVNQATADVLLDAGASLEQLVVTSTPVETGRRAGRVQSGSRFLLVTPPAQGLSAGQVEQAARAALLAWARVETVAAVTAVRRPQ